MEPFSITIQYTPEDLQQAYRLHNKKMFPVSSKLLLILAAISFFAGTTLLVYGYAGAGFVNWFARFLVVYGIALVLFYGWRVRTMGRRMFSKMPEFNTPYECTFSREGIRISNPAIQSNNAWHYYNHYIITDNMILLYPHKFRFNYFPRRCFTDGQFVQLRDWIIQYVPLKIGNNT
jgi:hypothetical protein